MNKNLIQELYGHTESTYYRWKKEDRPIISLIEKYFCENEIVEFLESGEIEKFNILKRFGLFDGDNELNSNLLTKIIRTSDDISPETAFADLLYYYYKNTNYHESSCFSENGYLEYLLEKTFISTEEKIFYLHENKFFLSNVLPYLNDFNHDFRILIEKIQHMSKYQIIHIIEEFIAPAIDMKYNKKCDFNTYDDRLMSAMEIIKNNYDIDKESKKFIFTAADLLLYNIRFNL